MSAILLGPGTGGRGAVGGREGGGLKCAAGDGGMWVGGRGKSRLSSSKGGGLDMAEKQGNGERNPGGQKQTAQF